MFQLLDHHTNIICNACYLTLFGVHVTAHRLLTACEQEQMLLLTSCQQTCMTYTIAVCTVKNS